MWVSSAIVTLSRKRRVSRAPTTRSSQLAATEPAIANTETMIMTASRAMIALPSHCNHSASSASGTAATRVTTSAVINNAGSCR
jgi:hypothetical protein